MTMDLKRILLYFALFMVSMTLWQNWINETQKHVKPTARSERPGVQRSQGAVAEPQKPTATNLPVAVERTFSKSINIKSNTLDVDVSLQGGHIIGAKLVKYPQVLHGKDPFVLLRATDNQIYLAENGVSGFGLAANRVLNYRVVSDSKFSEGKKRGRRLVITADISPGVVIEKTIEVLNGSYLVHVTQRVENKTSQPIQGRIYTQLVRQPPESSHGFFGVSSYTGAAVSLPPEKLYEKISYDKIKKENLYKSVKAGWVAMQQPYFISAWVPELNNTSLIYSHFTEADVEKEDSKPIYTIGSKTRELTINPQSEVSVTSKLYTGPVITRKLQEIAPGLELTIDYGIFWWISTPIFYVLKQIHDVLGNWGWSIVVITLLIKLLFFHLSAKSYHSMARLRQLQPRVDALRERYKDNKEKLTKAMMELYSKEKVSPFGGCLPIVVQIPVFIALYWVLIESVELRQAPWILWIQDLSAKDPYYILPVIMGGTMLLQQMLSPPPPDPTQKQVMMAMPIVFTFLFATFPAGLVLYWTVNNTVSILQQWVITKRVESQTK